MAGERAGVIARMLIAAGSLPEREQRTGAALFMLNAVVSVLFAASPSSPDVGAICASALNKLDFMKQPSPPHQAARSGPHVAGASRRESLYRDNMWSISLTCLLVRRVVDHYERVGKGTISFESYDQLSVLRTSPTRPGDGSEECAG